jgi:hypothetical protein
LTRGPLEISEASVAARQSIQAIVSATRSPFGIPVRLGDSQIADLERSMRSLELKLAERERIIGETEKRLAERERELYELEALLLRNQQIENIEGAQVALGVHAGVMVGARRRDRFELSTIKFQ